MIDLMIKQAGYYAIAYGIYKMTIPMIHILLVFLIGY